MGCVGHWYSGHVATWVSHCCKLLGGLVPPPHAVLSTAFSESSCPFLHNCKSVPSSLQHPQTKLVSSSHSMGRAPLALFWNLFTGLSHWWWAQQGLGCVLILLTGSTAELLRGPAVQQAGGQEHKAWLLHLFCWAGSLCVDRDGPGWLVFLPCLTRTEITGMCPTRPHGFAFVWPWVSKDSPEAHLPPLENGGDDTLPEGAVRV